MQQRLNDKKVIQRVYLISMKGGAWYRDVIDGKVKQLKKDTPNSVIAEAFDDFCMNPYCTDPNCKKVVAVDDIIQ